MSRPVDHLADLRRRCCDCEYCTHNRRRTRFYGRTRTGERRMWHRDITREYGQEIRL